MIEKENPSKMPIITWRVAVRDGHCIHERADSTSLDVQAAMLGSNLRGKLDLKNRELDANKMCFAANGPDSCCVIVPSGF